MSDEVLLPVNGVELCVQTFGDPADPAVLLIPGSGGSMTSWEDDFCALLTGRYVIRYDLRDTGRSVTYEPGAPGYTGDDLIEDAVGVLDALDIEAAHVVGISMGGALAQIVALDHPDRVRTLTLIATSPAGPGAEDLPGMPPETIAYFTELKQPDWSDRAAVIEHYVGVYRWFTRGPFDEEAVRAGLERDLDRAQNMASSNNHNLVSGGEPWRDRLGELRAPTLVLHGTEDPLFSIEHGQALADEIPNAELITLPGVGHELPRGSWAIVVPAILAHSAV